MPKRHGEVDAALADGSQPIEATYEAPYLAHARLEPYACVAQIKDGVCEVWTGTQIPGQAHSTAVQASGLPAANVQVHTTYMGGSFGSRGGGAFVAEAVEIAKAVGVPVKLTYSRDDELQHDLYRPASLVRFAAGLDADGWPIAWTARIACPTWMGLRNGVARESVEGIADYDIPNIQVEYHDPGHRHPDRLLAIGRALAEHVLRRELRRRTGRRQREGSRRDPPAARTRSRRGCSAC